MIRFEDGASTSRQSNVGLRMIRLAMAKILQLSCAELRIETDMIINVNFSVSNELRKQTSTFITPYS